MANRNDMSHTCGCANIKPEFRKPVFTVNMLQIRVDRVVNY